MTTKKYFLLSLTQIWEWNILLLRDRAGEDTVSAQGAASIMNEKTCPQVAKREKQDRTIEIESVEVTVLPVPLFCPFL